MSDLEKKAHINDQTIKYVDCAGDTVMSGGDGAHKSVTQRQRQSGHPMASFTPRTTSPLAGPPQGRAMPATNIKRGPLEPSSVAASAEKERLEKLQLANEAAYWKEKAMNLERRVELQKEQFDMHLARSKMENECRKGEYEKKLNEHATKTNMLELRKAQAEGELAKLQTDGANARKGREADIIRARSELKFVQEMCDFVKRECENLAAYALFINENSSLREPVKRTPPEHTKARVAIKEALYIMMNEVVANNANGAGPVKK
ncbi:hypothetical protein BKA56DRAFT_665995 [Ilyonectria sp. MPI-CAGE-AT-0026]|nr:hypothetical protein BKA56DRAFT_665995 [Ilyonectria sp. MPI-CAGE-AT-0026]